MVYWKAGKKLNNDKYVVNEILGSGGFGVTYKITEVRTKRLFALKTLNIEAQSRPDFDQLQTKFINEAIALASCPHPNIVRVYPQVFQSEGLWCMVMEYVEGYDLGRYLEKNGKLDEKKAIAIITKVGEALSSIHQKGFLHRDIKPANILLRSKDSEPVLIDFGLAREFIDAESQSMTNSRTESYAPLEQYQRRGSFGAWTDVYALAATLYNLLTARPPLPAKYRSETEYDLTPPKQCEPSISDRINEAILQGMEIEPGDRPQSVKAWLEMLKSPPPKPKPKPPIQPKYIEPPTVPIPPQPQPVIRTESRRNKDNSRSSNRRVNDKSDQESTIVSRRNWLKYSGLAIASMVVTLIGKNIVDNISEKTDSGKSTEVPSESDISPNQPQAQEDDLELAEYEFDVITVNDQGEEINREQNKAKYFTEDLGNGINLDMVEIPGGTFIMGSPEDEPKRHQDESPQQEVTVPSFYMAKFQVTQAQWKQVAALPQVERELKPDPSRFKGNSLPIENVNLYDAVEFCKRLSNATGKEYRLPSEAEWEYACRAGTTTPFHFGETITTDLVNYNGNYTYGNAPEGEYRAKTTPVGSFSPNAFGLYDMHGNLWEWCADTYQNSYDGAPRNGSSWVLRSSSEHVLRGGSWLNYPRDCRSAIRNWLAPVNVLNHIGFRCIASRTL